MAVFRAKRFNRSHRHLPIFYAAVPLGAALGFVLGGLIEQHYGWRFAFLIAGLPGLALALLVWLLKDPPRGANDPDREDSDNTIRAGDDLLGTLKTYGHLFTNCAFTLPVRGSAVIGGAYQEYSADEPQRNQDGVKNK